MAVKDASPLLAISGDFGEIEIRGPWRPPKGVMRGIDVFKTGFLRIVAPRNEQLFGSYTGVDGGHENWSPSSENGPALFEDTTYQLYLVGKHFAPQVEHRDPLFGRSLSLHPNQQVVAGSFNFGRQVGRSTIVFSFGNTRIELTIEVIPTKLDYATDYQNL